MKVIQRPRNGGKTHEMLIDAISKVAEGNQVYIISPTENQSKEVFNRAKNMVEAMKLRPQNLAEQIIFITADYDKETRNRMTPSSGYVYIDNADSILENIIGHRIELITLSGIPEITKKEKGRYLIKNRIERGQEVRTDENGLLDNFWISTYELEDLNGESKFAEILVKATNLMGGDNPYKTRREPEKIELKKIYPEIENWEGV